MSDTASWNTAGGFRHTLRLMPPDLLITLALDPQGNGYAPLSHHTDDHLYTPEAAQHETLPTDAPDAVPCAVLWPRPVLPGQQPLGLTVHQLHGRLLWTHPGKLIVLARDPEGNAYGALRSYSYGRLYYNPAADAAHTLSSNPQTGPECAVFWPQ
ncbi:hypothetical protein [Streptosporangium sp. CA-115845]|uniref:hypothetical protein n=1 Tax=Streptosporangium sp. CA-115845 TaxID=3240071 RepID=UPI003D94116A